MVKTRERPAQGGTPAKAQGDYQHALLVSLFGGRNRLRVRFDWRLLVGGGG